MISKAQKIQRKILFYVMASVIVTAVIISVVAIIPLYSTLKQESNDSLIFARNTSTLVVDEYLSHASDVAKQIVSRTKAKYLLYEYQHNLTNKIEAKAYLEKILGEALESSNQLLGIIRLDAEGRVVASVGKLAPNEFLNKKQSRQQIVFSDPMKDGKHFYVAISTPILYKNKEYIGSDITLFDISDLQRDLHEKIKYSFGVILLANHSNNEIDVFLPPTSNWNRLVETNPLIEKSLINSITHKKKGMIDLEDNDLLIAYAPISLTDWVVVVVANRDMLLGSIRNVLLTDVIAIILVTLIAVGGLFLFLRPLSGQIIMHSEDLKKQIDQGRVRLAEVNKKLQHFIRHDFLTNVTNRRGFTEALGKELARAHREKSSFLLVYIDINRFKQINDAYGHPAGDALLKTFAERLKKAVRQEDTVGRLGGDEFGIIAPHFDAEKQSLLLDKIHRLANIAVSFDGKEIKFTTSVGIAHYPNDGEDLESLIRFSDQAMYDAKEKFRRENPM